MYEQRPQTTVSEPARVEGIGLHSGDAVSVTVYPADVDSGITFFRSDLSDRTPIRAAAVNIRSTALATSLGIGEHVISTVEHLLSACAGIGIDNLQVEVDGPELPALDGSAAGFLELLDRAGVVEQSAPRVWARILRPVEVQLDDAWCRVEPWDGFRVAYELDYPQQGFRSYPRFGDMEVTPSSYAEEIAVARTFCPVQDYEAMRLRNLARGGSLENAVVVGEHGVLNPDGLRAPDEFVKHKLLDAIGDLRLLGAPMIGRFTGYKSGHTSNCQLVRQILGTADAVEFSTAVPEGCFSPLGDPTELRAAVT